MTAAHEKLYLRTLHALTAAGIEFCIIGTFALRQHCPALPRRQVADCDLMLPPDTAALNKLIQLLQASGWQATLWETPVSGLLSAAQLTGKYYLRARQAGAVLDCAYENELWTWLEFAAQCRWHRGLPLLTAEALMWQKEQSARPADLATLPQLRKLLSESAAQNTVPAV